MNKYLLLLVVLLVVMFITGCNRNTASNLPTEELVTNTIAPPTNAIPTSTSTATALPINTPFPPTETVTPTKAVTPTPEATPTIDELLTRSGLETTPEVDAQCNCTSWALPDKTLKVFFFPDHSVLISASTIKEVDSNFVILQTVLDYLYPNDSLVAKVVDTFRNKGASQLILVGDAYNGAIIYPTSDSIAFGITKK